MGYQLLGLLHGVSTPTAARPAPTIEGDDRLPRGPLLVPVPSGMSRPIVAGMNYALPFEDLEPQRYEALVRQLIYGYREWASLEALGRPGSSIRAVEARVLDIPNHGEAGGRTEERAWTIRCVRAKRLGPAALGKIVESDLGHGESALKGYGLVAAIDLSRRARDAFRTKVVEFGMEDFFIWGRDELTDRLYQPENDRLLFAYFGFSLRTKRKATSSALLSSIALKRAASNVFRDELQNPEAVLIRDAEPSFESVDSARGIQELPFNFWDFQQVAPTGLVFKVADFRAYVDADSGSWDCIEWDAACGYPDRVFHQVGSRPDWLSAKPRISEEWRALDPDLRGDVVVYGFVSFERMLAVDEVGDDYFGKPQLIVEYLGGSDLIEKTFERISWTVGGYRVLEARDRVRKFTTPRLALPQRG
jgi:hypothetical protein